MTELFLTVGVLGGLLDYTELHVTEEKANEDANRIAVNYKVPQDGEDKWHSEDADVWVWKVTLPKSEPERMTSEEWEFFTTCWLEGMKKVRLSDSLSDSWDSNDESQRLLNEVDRKLLKLKPLQVNYTHE